VAISLRELAGQKDQDTLTRDLVTFIALSLQKIGETVEKTVAPWEKRDYWVKADKFRMEWEWTGKTGDELIQALREDNWGQVALLVAKVSEKFSNEKVSLKHRMGTPWIGAWEKANSVNG
jgi:hypothetical protein